MPLRFSTKGASKKSVTSVLGMSRLSANDFMSGLKRATPQPKPS
jgi:hypothetical protein